MPIYSWMLHTRMTMLLVHAINRQTDCPAAQPKADHAGNVTPLLRYIKGEFHVTRPSQCSRSGTLFIGYTMSVL